MVVERHAHADWRSEALPLSPRKLRPQVEMSHSLAAQHPVSDVSPAAIIADVDDTPHAGAVAVQPAPMMHKAEQTADMVHLRTPDPTAPPPLSQQGGASSAAHTQHPNSGTVLWRHVLQCEADSGLYLNARSEVVL
jgi:hypothetical protein